MSNAWAGMTERGALWGIQLTAGVYRILGRTACRIMLIPVVAWFFVSGPVQRRASRDYLERMWRAGHLPKKPGNADVFRHLLTFAYASLDKLSAWTGGIKVADVDGVNDGLFDAAKKTGRGAMVISAHVGNIEAIRALATINNRFRVNVLVHTLHAERFNGVIEKYSPESPVRLAQVTQIDVGFAMRMAEAINRGEWLVIMGDRVAVKGGEEKSVEVDFLGAPAPQPIGPYVLAAALQCPVYTLFCVRHGKRFRIRFELLADPIELPRKDRESAIRDYAATYAKRVEQIIAEAPFQWFNFYDYWGAAEKPGTGGQ